MAKGEKGTEMDSLRLGLWEKQTGEVGMALHLSVIVGLLPGVTDATEKESKKKIPTSELHTKEKLLQNNLKWKVRASGLPSSYPIQ